MMSNGQAWASLDPFRQPARLCCLLCGDHALLHPHLPPSRPTWSQPFLTLPLHFPSLSFP